MGTLIIKEKSILISVLEAEAPSDANRQNEIIVFCYPYSDCLFIVLYIYCAVATGRALANKILPEQTGLQRVNNSFLVLKGSFIEMFFECPQHMLWLINKKINFQSCIFI